MATKGYALIDSATDKVLASQVPPASLTYTKVTVNTGDLGTGANYDLNITTLGFTRGIVEYARFERTAGTASMTKASLYDGDPASGGTFLCPLYGGDFVSINIPASGIIEGLYAAYGGATGVTSPVTFNSSNLYIRVTNADFSNNGTFTIDLYAREIVEPA